MEEKTSKSYEIGYLVRSEEGAGALIGHLKRSGAEILSEGELRSIKLSYPIQHLNSAHFGYVHFGINPELIGSLNDALKLDSQIVRFLLVTPPFLRDRSRGPEGASIQPRRVVKTKSEVNEGATVSNDLLEEKLEEILNQ